MNRISKSNLLRLIFIFFYSHLSKIVLLFSQRSSFNSDRKGSSNRFNQRRNNETPVEQTLSRSERRAQFEASVAAMTLDKEPSCSSSIFSSPSSPSLSPCPSSYVYELVVKVLKRKIASAQLKGDVDIEAVLNKAQEEILADCLPLKEADDIDGVCYLKITFYLIPKLVVV